MAPKRRNSFPIPFKIVLWLVARLQGQEDGLGGRPEKLDNKELEMFRTLTANGTPIKDIAKMWGISRTMVYRYLENRSRQNL
ncbi:hypothetical protein bcgnr5406_43100 [Bacillus cereus]